MHYREQSQFPVYKQLLLLLLLSAVNVKCCELLKAGFDICYCCCCCWWLVLFGLLFAFSCWIVVGCWHWHDLWALVCFHWISRCGWLLIFFYDLLLLLLLLLRWLYTQYSYYRSIACATVPGCACVCVFVVCFSVFECLYCKCAFICIRIGLMCQRGGHLMPVELCK